MPVEWSRLALEDLRSLSAYNNRRSSNSGTRMARKIRSTVNRLLSEELDLGHTGRVSRTRELVIPDTPYLTPYRVHLGHFEILRVYHHSRPWPDQL
jgi:toxin ParE1/3/4